MENQNQERTFTPEELEVKRKEMLKFYKESTPYLKAQFEHEELLMKIDEVRFKRAGIQMQYAMMMNQMENGPEQNGEDDSNEEYPFPTPSEMNDSEPAARKLKKQ